jgi:transposase
LIELAARHPEWALGFEDETWWSRVERPHLHSWAQEGRSLQLIEQEVARNDVDPKALACFGLWLPEPDLKEMWLRFVDGRPVSSITTQFLQWCCERLWAGGKRVLVMVWDNAGWHISKLVREWIKEYNWQVKQKGEGVRILAYWLPSKSPWLNPIEPKWLHAKGRVVEAEGLLSSQQLAQRVCDTFGTAYQAHLAIPEIVA